MSVRNPAWYTLNSTRPYPVDEAAKLTDDNGKQLPHHIITDLELRFPSTAGRFACLGGVTVTERLVTVTILSSDSPVVPPEASDSFTPLAAITLPKPIIVGKPYALDAQYPGVGGWIVFGPGVLENYSGRFSTVSQAMLVPRAARMGRELPVTGIGKLYDNSALTGIVRLRAGSDMSIVKASRLLDGEERDAIVFSLVNTAVDATRNVSDLYKGQCGARPETRNCGTPEPIENINGVQPDCCGVITLQLQGCLDVAVSSDRTAAVLDCSAGLIDVCAPPVLPNAAGDIPNVPGDECA